MKFTTVKIRTILLCVLMIPIILDSKTAVSASANAVQMCIKTVIPGVFPFMFLGSAIANELKSFKIPLLERLLKIPQDSAGYFLIGLICGYPVGAKLLQDAADRGEIPKSDAKRMMTFCNNASPAFIIGILSSGFSNSNAAVNMWLIQICTSIIIGMILPVDQPVTIPKMEITQKNKRNIMIDSIKAIASICGWVILFAIGLTYIKKSILTAFNPVLNTLLCGIMELTNGLCALPSIRSATIAYTLSAVLLSFGGVCVIMQTKSVAPDLDVRSYIFVRLFHCTISASMAALAACVMFGEINATIRSAPLLICTAIICVMFLVFNKKMVAFRLKV